MKLHELIETAVKEQDWLKVCAAYTAITGKPLSPPKPKVDYANFEIPDLAKLMGQFDFTGGSVAQHEDEEENDDEYDFNSIPKLDEDDYEENSDGGTDIDPPDEEDEPEPENKVSKKKGEFDQFAISHGVQTQASSQDGKTLMRKEPMTLPRERKNKFKDNLTFDRKDLKENNPILAKVYDKAGVRASRDLIEDAADTRQMIKVTCFVCNRTQKVSSIHAHGWNPDKQQNTYRCNECNTPSGLLKASRRNRDLGVYDG